MRTNIDFDDRLMRSAMRSSGRRRNRATVEEALRLLVQIKAQTVIRKLRGRIPPEENLQESRRS
jgi:Arc/MetJ family transcription regulator